MTKCVRSFVFLAGFFAVSAALNTGANAHFDIFVTNIGATQTGIGAADVDGGMFDIDTRVFESVMVASGAPDYSRDEPGFFALSNLAPIGFYPSGASALPGNAEVTFSFRTFTVNGNSAELFYWDGQGGSVNFMPASGRSISLSDSKVQATGTGAIDFHPDFEIDDPVFTAANGVYLASLTAKATATGVGFDPGPSAPIYLVMLVDESITEENAEQVEEDIEAGLAFQFFEEAVDYVATNVAVPEPASSMLALAGVGILGFYDRRRRR